MIEKDKGLQSNLIPYEGGKVGPKYCEIREAIFAMKHHIKLKAFKNCAFLVHKILFAAINKTGELLDSQLN